MRHIFSDSIEVELIKEENIVMREATVESSAFSYHQITSDIPVPQNVNAVIVRFTVNTNTTNSASNDDVNFYIDGVSLRSAN